MQRRTLPALAILTLGLVALAGVAPAAAGPGGSPEASSPAGAAYVAIGDSVAAGTGNQPYVDRDCLRSAKAYPMLVGAALGTGVASNACAGASAMEVATLQLDALGTATQLVTVTAGINDLDWQGALVACAEGMGNPACQSALGNAGLAINDMVNRVDPLVSAVRTAAPNAFILLTGYPMLFGEDTGPCSIGAFQGTPITVSADVTSYANFAMASLNYQIGYGLGLYVARTGDQRVGFVDVATAFDGHSLCDTGDRWVSGLVNGPVMANRSLHPNAAGQRAYATAVLAAID